MKKTVICLGMVLLLFSYPTWAQEQDMNTSIQTSLRVFYVLEDPDHGTVRIIYEFKNTAEKEINLQLSGTQGFPMSGSQLVRAYDIPSGSLETNIHPGTGVGFRFSKGILPRETYKIVFEMTLPGATSQTEKGWHFRQDHDNPFDWPLHEFEIGLTLPKGWYTLYDPLMITPGARIEEEDFRKTVIWVKEDMEPGEEITTVCEFGPKPHMYAIGQTVSIIMVILAFIFIFIIKKGFPSPMGFVRTIPGEDKPEKSNVIGAIEDLIRDAKKEVLITSPWIYYVDWFTSNIKQLTDRGVKVRILTWPSYERKKAGRDWVLVENKKQGFALSRFLAMFPEDTVRLNPSVHAKMIVVDRLKVMTSSSNLTQTGLWENYEAGIWMEDEEMAGKAADYFNKIWMAEDTVPLNQDMFNPHKLKKALGWDW